MTPIELKVALRSLEARVKVLEDRAVAPVVPAEPKVEGRAMCPKCGEKPNYHFHVKTCQGKKQE
jgi:hypothetical protein